MKLIDIKNRAITVELDPEDALLLADCLKRLLYADQARTRLVTGMLLAFCQSAALAAAATSYSDLPETYGLATIEAGIGPAKLLGADPA